MLKKAVKNLIEKFDMIKSGETVLVAVSGGPDSVLLLHILNHLRNEFGFKLHIAHLNHMLRKDSQKDEEFVKNIAKDLKLPVTTKKINVLKLAKKDSLEQVARRVRLDFLFDLAKSINSKKIALGHTKDDQAETILMRLIRGTGLYGLGAILPIREIKGFTLIRPLIEVQRKDVEKYLKKNKLKSMLDKTNLESKFFRNRVRKELLPLLEKKFNRSIKDTLCNLSNIAHSDYEYLSQITRRAFADVACKVYKDRIELDTAKLKELHKSLQRMVLRLALEKIQGDTRRLTYKHWEEIEALLHRRPCGSVVNLPRQISVLKDKKRFAVSSRKS